MSSSVVSSHLRGMLMRTIGCSKGRRNMPSCREAHYAQEVNKSKAPGNPSKWPDSPDSSLHQIHICCKDCWETSSEKPGCLEEESPAKLDGRASEQLTSLWRTLSSLQSHNCLRLCSILRDSIFQSCWGRLWWCSCLWVISAPVSNPIKHPGSPIGLWWYPYVGLYWFPLWEGVEACSLLPRSTVSHTMGLVSVQL